MCRDGYHVWQWGSSSTGDSGNNPPLHLRCVCGQMTWERAKALESVFAERDALSISLAEHRAALMALVDNAGGYDKSIVRALALQVRLWASHPVIDSPRFVELAERVLAAEEAGRRAILEAEPTTRGAALLAALAWYADERNYEESERHAEPSEHGKAMGMGPLQYEASNVSEDRGERARAALAPAPRAGEGPE